MKPNQEQLEVIEDILGSASKYRETYEELYDHILSALETVPDDEPFIKTLYTIVEKELGGKRGITLIEAKYRKAAIKEIAKKYFTYFGSYLISPIIIVVIACTILMYWGGQQSEILRDFVMNICVIINFVPVMFRRVEISKARHLGYYGKSSIVRIAYPVLRFLPLYLFLIVGLIYFVFMHSFRYPYQIDPYIICLIFFINMVNALTFYRLCKDEFKLSISI